MDLVDAIRKAIEIYNRFHSPEAVATLVKIDDGKVVVRFKGVFCYTCGVNDWIEDLKYVLEDLGIEAELINVMEGSDIDEKMGVFKIRKKGS